MKLLKAIALLSVPKVFAALRCALPSLYNWSSTDILAQPKTGWAGLRDFTHVTYEGQNLIYATSYSSIGAWGSMAFGPFASWPEMASVPQIAMNETTVAPTLFLFRPKNIWVLAYQWGPTTFSFKTSTRPSDPNSWSPAQSLFRGSITNSDAGPLDPALISDGKNIYLFFCGNNGAIYSTRMPIHQFPGDFGTHSRIVVQDSRQNAFESVQVYRVAGDRRYLMIVEAVGRQGRYFRSLTSTSLDGTWTPQAGTEENPFAGRVNSGATWTSDIGQGELIRSNPDETMTVDPCNLKLLYQGRVPSGDFEPRRYRPGLLSLKQ